MNKETNSFIDKDLLKKAKKDGPKLVFERYEEQQPQCSWGLTGSCCKNCFAGPCRIIPGKQDKGICGATADTIVARNLLRSVAAGAASHCDHAREAILLLLKIAEGKTKAYKIRDQKKLRDLAKKLGKKSTGNIKKVAKVVALEALEDFRRQEGLFHKEEGIFLNWLKITALPERIKTWKKFGILPVNADMETSHALHQTTLGCDADPEHLLLSTLKNGLVDGYAGMHMATNFQDIIFGTPTLTKSTANLGVLKKDEVNIIAHGHVPILSEKIAEWAGKLKKEAKKVGAKGINVVGMCCTGNELLMRLGIPMAGHILQSELAIVTGVVDAMVVDIQCIFPSLQDVASCYHTKLITTIDYVRIPGALHISFNVENADRSAKKIVLEAVKNFKNRNPSKIFIPKKVTELYGGFSVETILTALSKVNKKDPLKPLIDSIKKGEVLGVAAVVGCRNPKLRGKKFAEELMKILLKNNILVVVNGCIAHTAAQEGLMLPEATEKYAGKGLKKFLKKVGKANKLDSLPPVFHMGSCVDNSRIEVLLNAIAKKLKLPIYKLPVVASAPEYVTEKAVAIFTWVLNLGLTVHVNPVPPVTSAPKVMKFLTKDLEKITGGKVLLGKTPKEAANKMIQVIKAKRKKIGLKR